VITAASQAPPSSVAASSTSCAGCWPAVLRGHFPFRDGADHSHIALVVAGSSKEQRGCSPQSSKLRPRNRLRLAKLVRVQHQLAPGQTSKAAPAPAVNRTRGVVPALQHWRDLRPWHLQHKPTTELVVSQSRCNDAPNGTPTSKTPKLPALQACGGGAARSARTSSGEAERDQRRLGN